MTGPLSSPRAQATDARASAPIVAGSSTIELRAPSGTVLPATSSAYLVSDVTNRALSFVPTVLSGANSNDVVLLVNRSIPSGEIGRASCRERV